MTITETCVDVAASPEAVYALASATERWPLILPHYRYVRVRADGPVRTVEMAAWRGPFPLHWVAEQRNDAAVPHIAFRHLAGWTRGMDVEWQFERRGGSTRVTIVHRLAFAFPVAAEWLGKHVVSEFFIDGVARATLACMKRVAEAPAAS
ncbi:MAG: type II toxin-antitoxin system RatA family toxin [Candidatus Velthaea sp.]